MEIVITYTLFDLKSDDATTSLLENVLKLIASQLVKLYCTALSISLILVAHSLLMSSFVVLIVSICVHTFVHYSQQDSTVRNLPK